MSQLSTWAWLALMGNDEVIVRRIGDDQIYRSVAKLVQMFCRAGQHLARGRLQLRRKGVCCELCHKVYRADRPRRMLPHRI